MRNLTLLYISLALATFACQAKVPTDFPSSGDAGTGECVASSDCPSGEYCSLGICTLGTAPTGDSDPGIEDCGCTGLQTCDSSGACVAAPICTTDADCLTPQVCVTGACVDTPECRFSYDCPQGASCFEELGECGLDTCVTNADCPSTLVCAANGSCSQCDANSDCSGNQVCTGGRCFEGASCTNDGDCIRGRVCTTGSCENPACVADSFEPNDIMANAAAINAGITDITLCQFDADMLSLTNAIGDGLIVRATFDPSLGSININAYDSNEDYLGDGLGTVLGGTFLYTIENLPTATTVLEVTPVSGALIPVSLDVAIIPEGFCLDDDNEPNNDTTTAIGFGLDPPNLYVFATTCPNDEDWFSAELSAGSELIVIVDLYEGPPPIVELLDATGEVLLRDASGLSTKELVFTNDDSQSATYYVRILTADANEKSVVAVLMDAP